MFDVTELSSYSDGEIQKVPENGEVEFRTEKIMSFQVETVREVTINLDNITSKFFKERTREDVKSEIFDIIQTSPGISTSDIIDEIDYDLWTILEILDELMEEGKVE